MKKDIKVPYMYETTVNEDAIIKQVGDEYVATVFMNMDVYETMTNKSDPEMVEYAQYFERAISSLNEPVKISAILFERDMASYIRTLEDKKSMLEDRIATEKQKKKLDERGIEILEREKLMWERRVDSIYKNQEKPRSVEYIIATSAMGPSKDAALSAVKIRAREVRATFSGGMSLNIDELTRNRMKSCYEWEFMSPEW
jgi:hypothetical protein